MPFARLQPAKRRYRPDINEFESRHGRKKTRKQPETATALWELLRDVLRLFPESQPIQCSFGAFSGRFDCTTR
jgi:hypothetical protein